MCRSNGAFHNNFVNPLVETIGGFNSFDDQIHKPTKQHALQNIKFELQLRI